MWLCADRAVPAAEPLGGHHHHRGNKGVLRHGGGHGNRQPHHGGVRESSAVLFVQISRSTVCAPGAGHSCGPGCKVMQPRHTSPCLSCAVEFVTAGRQTCPPPAHGPNGHWSCWPRSPFPHMYPSQQHIPSHPLQFSPSASATPWRGWGGSGWTWCSYSGRTRAAAGGGWTCSSGWRCVGGQQRVVVGLAWLIWRIGPSGWTYDVPVHRQERTTLCSVCHPVRD